MRAHVNGARLFGLAVLAAAAMPASLAQTGPVLCPFRRATGRPCPACGLTRSWNALARLKPRRSVDEHPLGPALAVLAASLVVADGLGYRPRLDRSPPLVAAGAGLWVGVWLGRLARSGRALGGS